MKKKEFFIKLDGELQNAAPPLSEELKSMPITVSSESPIVEEENGSKKGFSFSDLFSVKKLAYFATAFVILFVSIFGVVSLSNNIKGSAVSDKVIVRVDINPSLKFVLNEQMQVEKIISMNADGDILLTSKDLQNQILGKSLKETVELIAVKATDLGFIDYRKNGQNGDYNKISVTAIGNKEKLPENLLLETQNHIIDCFKQKGIYLFVESGEQKQDNFNELLTSLNDSSALYMNEIKQNQADIHNYYKELVLDYCNDILIFSLNKYYIIKEVYELNEAIKNAQGGGILASSYWTYDGDNEEILVLATKTQEKLNQLNQIYGIDMTEKGIDKAYEYGAMLAGLHQGYLLINIEGLENLALTGITEELFSNENQLWLDFGIISAESILSDVVQLFNDITSGVQELTETRLSEMLVRLDEIKEKRVNIPNLSAISDGEYDAFLQLIGINK